MESDDAIAAFAALAQPTRLQALRLLVQAAPEGLAAGALADLLAVPANTLSAHLGVLSRAGLISSERHGRSIVYRAGLDRLGELVGFLLNDCCQGRAALCGPLTSALAAARS
ncbi:MAG: helix-turn-helix transcriptional regulator [Brevundimonas sp.]|uniref:ArsR/SmtB family transcription factor n=1 Tax=Brevundimonas sp. TaxID=1871086 RepID=UPI0017C62287|nr:helix-turn-helix transcriptional regulator [Brevundimonas sp.]MBA4803240.1 helix-turn-helix transcriptional regulator [Brevundimonas sp.]